MKRTTRTGGPIVRLCVLFFFALVTASCATAGHRAQKIRESLKAPLDAFNSDIRWQDFEHAEIFVPKTRVEHYWAEMDRLKRNIRLTDYEVRDIEFSENNRFATVTLHCEYWLLNSPILRNVNVTQTWRFNDLKEMWQVRDTGFKKIIEASLGF